MIIVSNGCKEMENKNIIVEYDYFDIINENNFQKENKLVFILNSSFL